MRRTTSTTSASPRMQILPSLTESKVLVPVFAPKANRPVHMPKAIDAWHRLQRIEHIAVVPFVCDVTSDAVYAVSVYFHPSPNRIPTNSRCVNESTSLLASTASVSRGSPRADAIPDLQVLRTFAELETLRHDVWTTIRQYHPAHCDLCDGLAVQMATTLSQPKLLTATIHRSPAKRAKKMHVFLLHILSQLHVKKAQCMPACKGQSALPIHLHGFLVGQEEVPTTRE